MILNACRYIFLPSFFLSCILPCFFLSSFLSLPTTFLVSLVAYFPPFPPYHFPCLPCYLLPSFPSLPLSLYSNLFPSLLSSFLFYTPFYLQDFSHVCPSFDLQRVNSLELSMLEALKYLIKVSAGVFSCPCACLHTFVV